MSRGRGPPPIFNPPAKVLVLSCIDPRFLSPLEIFLSNYSKIKGQYDHFILAGSSISLTITPNPSQLDLEAWKTTFTEHINVALQLHNFTEIWAFEHLDCGAYGALQEADTELNHINFLTRMKDIFMPSLNLNLKFKGFVMKLNGSIYKVVDSGGGIILDEINNNTVITSLIVIGILIICSIHFIR